MKLKGDITDMGTIKRNISLLLLKLKTQYSLPNSIVQTMVEDFAQILEISSTSMLGEIENVCYKNGVPQDVVVEIRTAFEKSTWKKAFEESSTDWRRNTFYTNAFPYVVPVEYKFCNDVMSSHSFRYVPLLTLLKVILANSSVREQVLQPQAGLDGHLSTFRDGTLYKNHAVFSSNQVTIELVLYSDKFEMVNALGPHKKKYKMFAFYFMLENLSATNKRKNLQCFC